MIRMKSFIRFRADCKNKVIKRCMSLSAAFNRPPLRSPKFFLNFWTLTAAHYSKVKII